MAFVKLNLEIIGETSGEVLEQLAEVGYTVSEGLAAQEGLELSDVCNDCRAAEETGTPSREYKEGGYYPILLEENSPYPVVGEYDGAGGFYLTGIQEAVPEEALYSVGSELEL